MNFPALILGAGPSIPWSLVVLLFILPLGVFLQLHPISADPPISQSVVLLPAATLPAPAVLALHLPGRWFISPPAARTELHNPNNNEVLISAWIFSFQPGLRRPPAVIQAPLGHSIGTHLSP